MVRLVQLQSVMPRIEPAWEVDASATGANSISQNRDKMKYSRLDDSRHREGRQYGLGFANLTMLMILFLSAYLS